MFDKVLVAIDGSDIGEGALAAARQIADKHSEIVVLNVLAHKVTWAVSVDLESDEEARVLVETAAKELEVAGFTARSEVVRAATDRTAEEIVRVADDLGSSIIVMGTHGRGDASALVLGSVAHSVLHRARCPVLLVPRGSIELTAEASSGEE